MNSFPPLSRDSIYRKNEVILALYGFIVKERVIYLANEQASKHPIPLGKQF